MRLSKKMNLQIALFRKSCIFRFVLLGEFKFSSGGRIRQLFDYILRYETYCPFAPLLSEGIPRSPGENLPYIVDHTVEQPLNVHLDPPS